MTSQSLARYCRAYWDDCEDSSLPGAKDTPDAFAKRVFDPRLAEVVIPYRWLLTLYDSWLNPHKAIVPDNNQRQCKCGCERVVLGRKQYATGACQRRHHRHAHGGEITLMKSAA